MILRLLLVILIFAAPSAASAGERVTGIYSNLTYNDEGGDLIGTELLILPREGDDHADYTVVVQTAEGGAPFVAVAPLKTSGDKFEFTLPRESADPGAHYTGKFDRQGLTLKRSGGTAEHLKRGKSYWQ
jgi:hypothetical protein